MGIDIQTYAKAKKYTEESLVGVGAVKGSPCTVSNIVDNGDGTHTVTFSWTATDGTTKTQTMTVKDGTDGTNGKDGVDGEDGIGISKIEKIKTEGLVDTYQITFSDSSTFEYTVTNGKDGSGSGGSTDTKIDSISVNGTDVAPDASKNVDITVPTKVSELDNDSKFVDETALKSVSDAVGTLESTVGDIGTIQVSSVTDLVSAINALYNSFMSGITYADKVLTIAYRNGLTLPVDISAIITDTNIGELSNINDTGVTDGQVLAFDTATSKYIPKTIDTAKVLEDAKSYTDDIVSKFTHMDAMSVDEKPSYADGTITYIKGGETKTTTNTEIWFYYVVDGTAYQTIWIDGVEFTMTVSGTVDFADFVSKTNDVVSTFTGEETDKTKVANIGALDALYALVKTALSDKVNTDDIVDTLVSDATDKPLSAKQGKVLDEKITGHTGDTNIHITTEERTAWNNKVDKEDGKGLSTNDFTDEYKGKVDDNATNIGTLSNLTTTEKTTLVGAINGVNSSVKTTNGKITINLLKPTLATTTTMNGVTITNNGDGTYTLNGTATAATYFTVKVFKELPEGKYKLTGTPITGRGNSSFYEAINYRVDLGGGVVIEHDGIAKLQFTIVAYEGTYDNVVYKPMLTTNINANYNSYVPYTGDTGQINSDLADVVKNMGTLSSLSTTTQTSLVDAINELKAEIEALKST